MEVQKIRYVSYIPLPPLGEGRRIAEKPLHRREREVKTSYRNSSNRKRTTFSQDWRAKRESDCTEARREERPALDEQ